MVLLLRLSSSSSSLGILGFGLGFSEMEMRRGEDGVLRGTVATAMIFDRSVFFVCLVPA